MIVNMKYLLLSLALLGVVGCSTPLTSTKEYKLGEIKIVLVDERNMSKTLEEKIERKYDPFASVCSAYYDTRNKTAYIPYSKNKDRHGNLLPNFEQLGHEVWHNVVGWFHEGTEPGLLYKLEMEKNK